MAQEIHHKLIKELRTGLENKGTGKETQLEPKKSVMEQLKVLLLTPSEYGCFSDVEKIPFYQSIIDGSFMKKSEGTELLTRDEEKRLIKRENEKIYEDMVENHYKRENTKQRIMITAKYVCVAAALVCTNLLLFNSVFASELSKFDIDGGAAAVSDPIINKVKAHWVKGILLTGAVFGLCGEGDASQRTQQACIGAAAAGGLMLGIVLALT